MNRLKLLGVTFSVIASASSLLGQANEWTGAVNSDWGNAGNWSLAAVPLDDSSGIKQESIVHIAGGTPSVIVSNDTDFFYPALVTESEPNLYVGYIGDSYTSASFTVNNGASFRMGGTLFAGGDRKDGRITVDGSDSSLLADGSLYLRARRGGTSEMIIKNGGSVSVRFARIAEANTGSLNGHDGILDISGGSSFYSATSLIIAGAQGGYSGLDDASARASGSINVRGAGSSVESGGALHIGNDHDGVFSISDQASVTVGDRIYIANRSLGATGVLNIGNGGNNPGTFSVAGGEVIGGAGDALVRFNHVNSGYVFDPALRGSLSVEHIGSGTTILTGSSSYSGSTTVSHGRLEFGNGNASTHLLAGDIINNSQIEVDSSGTSIFSGDISGSGGLELNGGGTLVLSGSNTLTGDIRVNAGDLHVGSGGTTGNMVADIMNDGEVLFNRSDASTYAGDISGTGSLVKSGAGNLTMTGDHTFTGVVDIEQGTLTLDGSFGSGGDVTIFTNATFAGSGLVERDVVINAGGTLDVGLNITGEVRTSSANNLGNVSSGTQTAGSYETLIVVNATGGTIDSTAGLADVSTLDGSTVNAGDLGATVDTMTSGQVNSTGGVRVDTLNGGNINVGSGANVTAQQGTYNGTIDGDGGLVKQGNGTLRLESNNNYGGTTEVWGGTLEILNLGALGRVPVVRLNSDTGKFRVVDGTDISDAEVVITDPGGTYEHVFDHGDDLGNTATISNGDNNTTARIGAGTSNDDDTIFHASYTADNRLSLEGIDGMTFGLLMNGYLPDNYVPEDAYLGWLDPSDGEIKNAVVGNHGEDGILAGYHNMSFEEFLAANDGWNAATMLGAYGSDLLEDEVWAVIDHNSEFSVVPESSAYALLLGALAFGYAHSRRRR